MRRLSPGDEALSGLNSAFLSPEALAALGFRSLGRDVRLHSTCVVVNPQLIAIGDHVRIDPYCVLSVSGGLTIGNHVHVASHVVMVGSGAVRLDDFCGISIGSRLIGSSDDFSGRVLTGPTVPAEFVDMTSTDITVGRHALVGANSVLLPGAGLGEGTAVGAMSRVSRHLEPWTVHAGNPLRQLGERRRDLLALEAQLLARERDER